MSISNILIFGVLILVLAVFSGVQSRREQLRPTRGFKEMELAVARSFGKRAINMNDFNQILMQWIALEARMRNLRGGGGPAKHFPLRDELVPE